jgi:hypothetical protein
MVFKKVAQQIRNNLKKYNSREHLMLFCECCSSHLPATIVGVSMIKEGLERGLISTLDAVLCFLLERHSYRCSTESISQMKICVMFGAPKSMHVSFPDNDRLNKFSCEGNNHRLEVPTYFFNEESDNDEDLNACVIIKVSSK